jgi:hypothetical protein
LGFLKLGEEIHSLWIQILGVTKGSQLNLGSVEERERRKQCITESLKKCVKPKLTWFVAIMF